MFLSVRALSVGSDRTWYKTAKAKETVLTGISGKF